MGEPQTTVTFLGTGGLVPVGGHDSSCFVINGRYLVDTGWSAAANMSAYGLNAADIEYLFITHLHCDHAVGLPQLLLRRDLAGHFSPDRDLPPLKIVGPATGLVKAVRLARSFLAGVGASGSGSEELLPLSAGGSFDSDEFRIVTRRSFHTAPGLVYRFTDKRTGVEVAFTGDTRSDPTIVDHVAEVSLLIHDTFLGSSAEPGGRGGHSTPEDAARTALQARAGRLALIHGGYSSRRKKVAAAQVIFPETFWPEDGQTVVVGEAASAEDGG